MMDWRMGALMWTGSLLCTACVGELSLIPGPNQSDGGVRNGIDAAPTAPNDAAQSAPGDAGDNGPIDVDAGRPGVDGGGVVAAGAGLPCDVATLLARCAGCHGPTPSAPISLVDYEDLTAESRVAGLTVAELAVRRMNDDARPMPPAPAARVDDTSALEAWIADGMPREECGGEPEPEPTDPFAGPSVCTSDTFWTRGNSGSPLMHPGGTCLDCHARMNGPRFSLAGTVFPTGHEPIDCNGLAGTSDDPVTVEITDANGVVTTLQTNAAGNFRTSAAIALPFTARVLYQGRVRAMQSPQRSGDCNGCHTENGANGAPGRVVAP